ncbi:MAG: ATP-binding protein, partial [Pseudomonadota bacterium]
VVHQFPMMERFFDAVQSHLHSDDEWQEEIIIFDKSGRKILRVRGTTLLSQTDDRREQVVVVDDLTELIQAQKESAWSEMARRLAHEIKNPLTPIQLSAERLQRKLSGEVSEEKQDMLDRYTHTIVQQVEAMKSMVNAFTEYARSPAPESDSIDLNAMLEGISDLYLENNSEVEIELKLDASIKEVQGDDVRLRQLLHNLIKNSMETLEGKGSIILKTEAGHDKDRDWIDLSVEDSGSGIADEIAHTLFEPYVTTKSSGSGLGLAIVQKIVDEHGGSVRVSQSDKGGARFTVRLPGNESVAVSEAESIKSGVLS